MVFDDSFLDFKTFLIKPLAFSTITFDLIFLDYLISLVNVNSKQSIQ